MFAHIDRCADDFGIMFFVSWILQVSDDVVEERFDETLAHNSRSKISSRWLQLNDAKRDCGRFSFLLNTVFQCRLSNYYALGFYYCLVDMREN